MSNVGPRSDDPAKRRKGSSVFISCVSQSVSMSVSYVFGEFFNRIYSNDQAKCDLLKKFSHGVLEGDEEKKLENKQWVLVVYG